MDADLRARRTLELDLRKALAVGEFELYYQPLVTLETSVIYGFEALLRWHHPVRGMVAPAEFIPLAEETGLIVPIGEWLLRQACAGAAAWPDDLKVSVNFSPVQFKKGNLPQLVVAALASSGLPAERLELEITESTLLVESETNLATLHSLRALGVTIAMDDFGTDYSGLSYLRAFPFDRIKIDRSFISELGESRDCTAIVRAIADLGSHLGIPTLAEGAETEKQLAWVRETGCTEMQGYLFSRPIPASEIAKLLSSQPNCTAGRSIPSQRLARTAKKARGLCRIVGTPCVPQRFLRHRFARKIRSRFHPRQPEPSHILTTKPRYPPVLQFSLNCPAAGTSAIFSGKHYVKTKAAYRSTKAGFPLGRNDFLPLNVAARNY